MKKLLLVLMCMTSVFASTTFLLIGDSASKIGAFYGLNYAIISHGKGWVLVADTSVNNTSSSNIVANIDSFIVNQNFDYIILNYGIHDAANMHEDTAAGAILYKSNSCIIADSLRVHNKKVVFNYTTPMLGRGDLTCWGKDSAFWNALIPRLNSIAKNVFDSIVGPENMLYVDQYNFARYSCSECGYDSVHFTMYGNFELSLNTYDTLNKYIYDPPIVPSDPEYSSYGITAPDSNITGMAEYSSYGIDARGFNNYWLNSTGRYADSVCNWSNGSIPDSMDAVTTIGGGNKILFTAGTTYKMRTLTTSGTSGSPDSIVSGTPGAQDTVECPQDTVPYFYTIDQWMVNPRYLPATSISGGNNHNIKTLSYTGVTKDIYSGAAGATVTFTGPGFVEDCWVKFGTDSSALTVVSYTSATKAVPALAAGVYAMTVGNSEGDLVSAGNFTITAAGSSTRKQPYGYGYKRYRY